MKITKVNRLLGLLVIVLLLQFIMAHGAFLETIKIGLNYPKTGPYAVEGLDQLRAAKIAVEEINVSNGILGNQIELIIADSLSDPKVSKVRVDDLVKKENVRMVFGGSSSAVAIEVGNVCRENNILFFGTLTYSTETTCESGHTHIFRECYDSWMAAKALASYLNEHFEGKNYFYITADYTWGWTTEDSLRIFTATEDKSLHQRALIPFPEGDFKDFRAALNKANESKADVLVFVLFGEQLTKTINIATGMGLKEKMQFIVPNITLGMAEGGGPIIMEGVIGALPWAWRVPYKYNYPKGKEFVEKFIKRYNRYPCTAGASAYTILYEYKDAVERAGSFETSQVIKALEGHPYECLKNKQTWRAFDHQSIQDVYVIRCKPAEQVFKDKFRLDYFDIIDSFDGEKVARTKSEWEAARIKAGKSTKL